MAGARIRAGGHKVGLGWASASYRRVTEGIVVMERARPPILEQLFGRNGAEAAIRTLESVTGLESGRPGHAVHCWEWIICPASPSHWRWLGSSLGKCGLLASTSAALGWSRDEWVASYLLLSSRTSADVFSTVLLRAHVFISRSPVTCLPSRAACLLDQDPCLSSGLLLPCPDQHEASLLSVGCSFSLAHVPIIFPLPGTVASHALSFLSSQQPCRAGT